MSFIIVIIFAIVQGVAEFFPISSSGHLALVDRLFADSTHPGFAVGALLNIGTLSALIWYCRSQLKNEGVRIIKKDYDILLKIIVASIPAGLVGFFLADRIEGLHDNLGLMLTMLIGVGLLMVFFDKQFVKKENHNLITWPVAIGVGLAQVLALVPGTSRLGITILVGIWLGLSRSIAAYWSLALAIPITAGAILKVLFSQEGFELVNYNFSLIVVGNIISFLVGMLTIRLLFIILKKRSLFPFGYYRISLGLVLLILIAGGVIN